MTLDFRLTDGTPVPPADDRRFDAVLALLREGKVTHLSLSGPQAGMEHLDALAECVAGNAALESVDISHARNTSPALARLFEALALAPNLREFNATHCFGDTDAARAMADLLATHPRLERADVCYNTLHGQKVRMVADAVTHSGGLRELDISYNAMGDQGVTLLAQALERNRGLVKINVDTHLDILPGIPDVEHMLDSNRNLLECRGITSGVIEERLARNRERAETLADAILADPAALTETQLEDAGRSMAAVSYVMEHERGIDRAAVMERLTELLVAGRAKGVDNFPAMMAVFPVAEMFDLSARLGHPLTMRDFHSRKDGGTPLLGAIIQRGAGASLFRKDMGWQSGEQVDAVYNLLPEAQQRQVGNRFQLRAYVQAQTRQGVGRYELA